MAQVIIGTPNPCIVGSRTPTMATVSKESVRKTSDKQPSMNQREQVQYQPKQGQQHATLQNSTSTPGEGSKVSDGLSWDTSKPLSWKPEPMGVGIASWNKGNEDEDADERSTTSTGATDEPQHGATTNEDHSATAPQPRTGTQAPTPASSTSPRKTRRTKRRSKDWPKTQNVMERREYEGADSSKPAMKGGELGMEQKVGLSWDTEKPLSWMN